MKKALAVLLTFGVTAVFVSGCTGTPVAIETPNNDAVQEELAEVEAGSLKTGLSITATLEAENASEETNGTITTNISMIAVTVDQEGVIESCVIDAVQGAVSFGTDGALTGEVGAIPSKVELGDAYGMKAFSPIGKEWNEQVAAIAEYAQGKTVEQLKNGAIDEYGVVKDADLAASATIYLGSFVNGIEDAVSNAQYLGAKTGDKLVLTAISNSDASTAASEETQGNVSVASNIVALTKSEERITSCIIDSVQSEGSFDMTGTFTGEAGTVLSKNQLGENYGLKQYSPIGKEWNEQTRAFCDYVTGKTAGDIAGIAVTETTAPAEADLAASVSIAIGDFMALIEKAAN